MKQMSLVECSDINDEKRAEHRDRCPAPPGLLLYNGQYEASNPALCVCVCVCVCVRVCVCVCVAPLTPCTLTWYWVEQPSLML